MLVNQRSESIDLEGTWQFALGDQAGWGSIDVPGSWEAQGYSKYVDGPARYRRVVTLPADWAGQRIVLECGAVSYACTVFCNGVEAGRHLGLWTPFTVDLTAAARPGETNQIELLLYKPFDYIGPNGHRVDGHPGNGRYPTRSSLSGFLPDVATTFGGIWQSIRLRALTCAFSEFQASPEYDTRTIHVRAQAETFGAPLAKPAWTLAVSHNGRLLVQETYPFTPGCPLDAALTIDSAQPWSPDSPTLYDVQLSLITAASGSSTAASGSSTAASATLRTGFRKLSAQGDQLLLNGQPFLVRGILSWGWEPDRVAPIYSLDQAREEMRKARAMGFNLVKLCLVIPSPAYFDAADEEGMLLWEELPMWLPEVTEALRAQAPVEYAEIARMLAHHPSVAIYSLGCELSQSVDGALMDQMNSAVRGVVRDVQVCDNSGSGESYGGLDFDFADFTDYHPYYDLQFFEPLLDNWRRDWKAPRPWIFGEFCDSDTFRDLREIIQASGGQRPWWLTSDNPVTHWRAESRAVLEWEQRLDEASPGLPLEQIVDISYRQSYVIRKYTLETLRKRRGMGGYVVTGLRDTPISTSGVWDDFGRPKWPAEAFTQINGEAILTLDVVRRRRWTNGGDRPDRLDPFNYWSGETARWYVILHDTGPGFPSGTRLSWSLTAEDARSTASSSPSSLENGEQVANSSPFPKWEGGRGVRSSTTTLSAPTPSGDPHQVCVIQLQLPETTTPVQLRLEVHLSEPGGRTVTNAWPVWVYPQPAALPAGLAIYDPTGILDDFSDALKPLPRWNPGAPLPPYLVATGMPPDMIQSVASGARVLLLQQGEGPLPVRRCPFWREGIKLFPKHPLWSLFPQQGFSDMQFFGLASDLAFDTVRLGESLPGAQIRPILRRLDARQFHMAEYLFEARIGSGLLLGCALRLQGGMGAQPDGWERNVAGGAMFDALLHCLENPTGSVIP